MTVAGETDGVFTVIVEGLIFECTAVKFQRKCTFGAAEDHTAFRNGVAHGGTEGNQNIVAVLGDTDLIVFHIIVAAERSSFAVGIGPGKEFISADFVFNRLIFRNEEVTFAERGDPGGQALAEPVDQIKVVTAFFQNMRTGNCGMTPPVADNVTAMGRSDIFIGFDGHDPAEFAAFQKFFGFAVDRGVTEYKAGGEKFAAFLMGGENFLTIFNGGGKRFFAENIFAGGKGFQNMLFVIDVGREDHHPFDTRGVDSFHTGIAFYGAFDFEIIAEAIHRLFIRIKNGCHFHCTFGISQQMSDYTAGSAAIGDYRHIDFFLVHYIFLLENFFGNIYIIHRKQQKRMDKNCIMNDKKIEVSQSSRLHRLIASMPESARDYGFWIINGSIEWSSKVQVSLEKDADRRFEFYSLSHMVKGKGVLRIGSREWDMRPGDAVLICPGDWHLYGAVDNELYCEDSIRFCGKVPDFMRKNGLLRSGLVHLGTMRKLIPIVENSRSPVSNVWMKAALDLQQLLLEINSLAPETSPIEALLKTVADAPPEHWWSVAELAELRGISSDRLRREFLRHTGLLPKNYLEQFKLRQAAEFLVTFQASVTDTAVRFGYLDRYHFSRRFKLLFGLSPEQYRKLFAPGMPKE